MKHGVVWTAMLLLGLAAGCARAPQTHYYILDMRPSGQAAQRHNIEVGRLRAAESLASGNIFIRRSPTEVEYYAGHSWASSLPELVAEKLQAEFGPAEESRDTLVASGVILAFGQVDRNGGADAHIKLDLALRSAGMSDFDPPLMQKTYETFRPARASRPNAVVEALSAGIEDIAAEIIADAMALSLPVSE